MPSSKDVRDWSGFLASIKDKKVTELAGIIVFASNTIVLNSTVPEQLMNCPLPPLS